MRVCVVGAGIAGALLAWRLSDQPGIELTVAPGPPTFDDATVASGGAVRGYENAAAQRLLALDSFVELLASSQLREWSAYRETGCIYLPSDTSGVATAASDIDAQVPGSVSILGGADLARRGWAGLADDAVAVYERRAGYLNPDRLRRAVLSDLSGDFLGSGVVEGLTPDGFALNGERHRFDVVVLATGAATPELLSRSGLAANELRSKSIQFSLHPVADWCPPVFCDESTGLYGIPREDGLLLLGLPTDSWDVRSGDRASDPALVARAEELARTRFPLLKLGDPLRTVSVPDCYSDTAELRLRPVDGTEDRLFTFTGGSGGAAKTALAASRRAAIQLADTAGSREETQPTLIGWTSQS